VGLSYLDRDDISVRLAFIMPPLSVYLIYIVQFTHTSAFSSSSSFTFKSNFISKFKVYLLVAQKN